jgi:hypothetical protein
LETVLRHHGDREHPLDDPLWDSWEIQGYLLAHRPDKLTNPEHKKFARQRTQAKSYKKRVAREMSDEGKLRKQRYEHGEIPLDEYRSILTGNRRRKFDEKVKLDEECQVRVALEQRMQQLETRLFNEAHSPDNDLVEELAALKSTSSQLESARRQAEETKRELVSMCAEVVRSWGTTEARSLLIQDLRLPDMHYQFPDAVNDQSFYD